MKLAFADAHAPHRRPRHMDATPEDLLDPAYLAAERARLIDPNRALRPRRRHTEPGGTVYLTAADAEGNMVSYIQSNYTGFGSGIVVPGTGIALQNRGCCFTLEKTATPTTPRAPPSARTTPSSPASSPAPTTATSPVMSFGVMGGFMQPQGHAQVLVRIADFNQNPQAALDAPRWQVMRDTTSASSPASTPESTTASAPWATTWSCTNDAPPPRARPDHLSSGRLLKSTTATSPRAISEHRRSGRRRTPDTESRSLVLVSPKRPFVQTIPP
jgi:gamma-glutamyltranspeptidase/glutathione hydrolase